MLKRILFLLTFIAVYVIVKEFLSLYASARTFHPYAGYAVLLATAAVFFYFIFLPVLKVLRLPRHLSPVLDPKKVPELIRMRMRRFQKNPRLTGFSWDDVPMNEKGYARVIEYLEPEVKRIRKKYVVQLFYGTAVAQNGFLDAVLILSAGVNLVKELFVLYHGRVTNRNLWVIAKKIYFSMAVGGSEGVEYATEELFSKGAIKGIKNIPFAARVVGSLADGFINAVLLNRISIITENYCKRLLVSSDRDLYPTTQAVISSTTIILSDLVDRLLREVKKFSKENQKEMLLVVVNPVGYLLGAAMTRMAVKSTSLSSHQSEVLLESASIAKNPFAFAMRKIGDLFRKRTDVLA